ncbi:hypothetical protein [Streptomyces xanthophaeus]
MRDRGPNDNLGRGSRLCDWGVVSALGDDGDVRGRGDTFAGGRPPDRGPDGVLGGGCRPRDRGPDGVLGVGSRLPDWGVVSALGDYGDVRGGGGGDIFAGGRLPDRGPDGVLGRGRDCRRG